VYALSGSVALVLADMDRTARMRDKLEAASSSWVD